MVLNSKTPKLIETLFELFTFQQTIEVLRNNFDVSLVSMAAPELEA